MNLFNRYSLKELHEELGKTTFLSSKRNYELNYKEYIKVLKGDPTFLLKIKTNDKEMPVGIASNLKER